MKRLIDWFVPYKAKSAGPDALRRARLLVTFSYAVAFWGPFFCYQFYFVLGVPTAGLTMFPVTVVALLVPVVLKLTGSVKLAGNLLCLDLFCALLFTTLLFGGHISPSMHWVVAIPMIAICTAGIESGAIWAILACAKPIVFYLLDRAGVPIIQQLTHSAFDYLELLSISTLVVFVFSIAWLYEFHKRQAMEMLNEVNHTLANANVSLSMARHEADLANRAKSEFLANTSHEIRTPMTAILGYSDVLLDPSNSEEDRLIGARAIRLNGTHLMQIINDILDISKIEAGCMDLEKIRYPLAKLLWEAESLSGAQAKSKGLSFKIECIGTVPEEIETDPTRLRQIIVNLVDNAIKFTESGSVRVQVRHHRNPDGDHLSVDVIDSGIGLSEEAADRLFKPFTQADASTTRKFGGTGLGLTVSRRLANLLGGDLELRWSQTGKGCHFRASVCVGNLDGVRFIKPDEMLRVLTNLHLHDKPPPDVMKLPKCRILLAEDGVDNQRLISLHLTKAGANVKVASNGRIAVEEAIHARDNNMPFDLILMDMQMPELDGYSATRILRQRGFYVPIIALTAHAMVGDCEKCIAAGCQEYLAKPIDRVRLIDTIRSAIESNTAAVPAMC